LLPHQSFTFAPKLSRRTGPGDPIRRFTSARLEKLATRPDVHELPRRRQIPCSNTDASHRLGKEGTERPHLPASGDRYEYPHAALSADNKLTLNAEWDLDRLAIEIAGLRASDFDISLIEFSESEIDDLLKADEDGEETGAGSLAERFMIAPFSVLNARGGSWQERKAAWLALGIQSELGRGENSAIGGAPMPLDRANACKSQGSLNEIMAQKRKPTAEPGGSKMPAADYRRTRARGDGRGRSIDPQG
jgi:hypothetical protein